ncbi:hypothetical protein BDY24DRAFT_2582 [Mrakia frigida]|uniref:uncharacterized protein n=1 Tax=Mrakia frigida TaxID=29902 RepID=UPI003FCC12CF
MNGYLLLFVIVITMVNAFLAAALAATGHFCFASVASGSVVLVLPGYLFLAGSLELGNRAVVSGSTQLVYGIIHSLMLGFGLSVGSEVYIRVTGTTIRGSSDYTCSALRLDAPWYRATISPWFYFFTIPAYTLSLVARHGQPIFRIQSVVMMALGSAGFSANYFSGRVFTGRPDITSTFGSFVVGVLGGIYERFMRGSAFVVIVPGILLQLPSGTLGLLRQASDSTTQERNSFASGYSVSTQLISVSIGLSSLVIDSGMTSLSSSRITRHQQIKQLKSTLLFLVHLSFLGSCLFLRYSPAALTLAPSSFSLHLPSTHPSRMDSKRNDSHLEAQV